MAAAGGSARIFATPDFTNRKHFGNSCRCPPARCPWLSARMDGALQPVRMAVAYNSGILLTCGKDFESWVSIGRIEPIRRACHWQSDLFFLFWIFFERIRPATGLFKA